MKPIVAIRPYIQSLLNPRLAPTAFKVAVVVGSLLFLINHGWAVWHGEMTPSRWLSGGFTYVVPYMVNIHGQYISQIRTAKRHASVPL